MTQINQIMNDPERMKEISQIASMLGITSDSLNNDLSDKLGNTLNSRQKKDEKQQALVQALLPYLRPNHQKKLERALKLVQLTHLAGVTMQFEHHSSESEELPNDI